jgi:hypothetical protein
MIGLINTSRNGRKEKKLVTLIITFSFGRMGAFQSFEINEKLPTWSTGERIPVFLMGYFVENTRSGGQFGQIGLGVCDSLCKKGETIGPRMLLG